MRHQRAKEFSKQTLLSFIHTREKSLRASVHFTHYSTGDHDLNPWEMPLLFPHPSATPPYPCQKLFNHNLLMFLVEETLLAHPLVKKGAQQNRWGGNQGPILDWCHSQLILPQWTRACHSTSLSFSSQFWEVRGHTTVNVVSI